MNLSELYDQATQPNANGFPLLRAIASMERWIVPAAQTGDAPRPLVQRIGDEQWMVLFARQEDYEGWLSRSTREGDSSLFLSVPGPGALMSLGGELTGAKFVIDTERTFALRSDRFPMVKEVGQIVAIEQVLAGKNALQNPWKFIYDFEGFMIPRQHVGEKIALMWAPDSQGRKLVPVLTGPDCAAAFLEQARAATKSKVDMIRLKGGDLFKMIQEMPAEGIVFNPCGPITPAAVQKSFADMIVASGQPQP